MQKYNTYHLITTLVLCRYQKNIFPKITESSKLLSYSAKKVIRNVYQFASIIRNNQFKKWAKILTK